MLSTSKQNLKYHLFANRLNVLEIEDYNRALTPRWKLSDAAKQIREKQRGALLSYARAKGNSFSEMNSVKQRKLERSRYWSREDEEDYLKARELKNVENQRDETRIARLRRAKIQGNIFSMKNVYYGSNDWPYMSR